MFLVSAENTFISKPLLACQNALKLTHTNVADVFMDDSLCEEGNGRGNGGRGVKEGGRKERGEVVGKEGVGGKAKKRWSEAFPNLL